MQLPQERCLQLGRGELFAVEAADVVVRDEAGVAVCGQPLLKLRGELLACN